MSISSKIGILDVLTRIQRIDGEQTKITINGLDDSLYRRIHIGNYETPPNELGEDGDLYIFNPNEN